MEKGFYEQIFVFGYIFLCLYQVVLNKTTKKGRINIQTSFLNWSEHF